MSASRLLPGGGQACLRLQSFSACRFHPPTEEGVSCSNSGDARAQIELSTNHEGVTVFPYISHALSRSAILANDRLQAVAFIAVNTSIIEVVVDSLHNTRLKVERWCLAWRRTAVPSTFKNTRFDGYTRRSAGVFPPFKIARIEAFAWRSFAVLVVDPQVCPRRGLFPRCSTVLSTSGSSHGGFCLAERCCTLEL